MPLPGLLANNFVKAAEDKKYSKLVMAGGRVRKFVSESQNEGRM